MMTAKHHHFIIIENEEYEVNTKKQIAVAKAAMREAGIDSAFVWSGYAPDSVKTSIVVLAN